MFIFTTRLFLNYSLVFQLLALSRRRNGRYPREKNIGPFRASGILYLLVTANPISNSRALKDFIYVLKDVTDFHKDIIDSPKEFIDFLKNFIYFIKDFIYFLKDFVDVLGDFIDFQ